MAPKETDDRKLDTEDAGHADERRIHARIEAALPAEVWAADRERISARIHQLSHSGAVLRTQNDVAAIGDTLTLEIWPPGTGTEAGGSITVMGEVVRSAKSGYLYEYGLKFAAIEPRRRLVLRTLINHMLDADGVADPGERRGRRQVPITCHSKQATLATLQDIARGDLSLHCDLPLVVSEDVEVDVTGVPDVRLTNLPAQVVHVRTVSGGRYHVGLRFTAPSDERLQELNRLIAALAD